MPARPVAGVGGDPDGDPRGLDRARRARMTVPGLRRRPVLPARLPALLGRGGRLRCSRWPATCGSSRRRAGDGQPAPFGQIGARLAGLIEYALVQTKMFRDSAGRPDARRDLLGLRAADDRDGQHRHRRAVQTVLSSRSTALLWTAVIAMQNVVAVDRPRVVALGVLAAPRHAAGAARPSTATRC